MVTGWSLHEEDLPVLALHTKPEEYEERLVLAGCVLHDAFRQHAAPTIKEDESILDIGSGTGMAVRVLADQGHKGRRCAVDLNKEYLDWTKKRGLYNCYALGSADLKCRQLWEKAKYVDWSLMISMTYYFSPERFANLMHYSRRLSCKGIVLTLDGVTDKLSQEVKEKNGVSIKLYDHRQTFRQLEQKGWAYDVIWSGIGWHHSKSTVEVPCEMIVMQRQL